MKLRTQILLFLLPFALAPLFVAVVINLPLVLDRLEHFYRQAYLQNLRADFRDLDQHLASRDEMIKLLAKLPEPGAMLGEKADEDAANIDRARARYTEWINRILPDQLDIIQIAFLDSDSKPRFWLLRDAESFEWKPAAEAPALPSEEQIAAVLDLDHPRVLVSPLSLDAEAGAKDPRQFMTLRLASPIGLVPGGRAQGAVVMTLDVGGMARRYHDTLWVRGDGSYLEINGLNRGDNAFDDFQGLRDTFSEGKPALWEHDNRQMIWVPLILTESGPLWVGRSVDPTPLRDFQFTLSLRVLSIIFVLANVTWLVARWFALRAERVGRDLTDGITRMLEDDESVRFDWHWTEELRRLGNNLTRLAEKHARNNRRLRDHARELEESNRYKSEFLANVSHELRTPLNSILLLSKLLADQAAELGPERSQQARVIHQAGRDLQALIDNILDLSRIEARQTSFHLEHIELPRLLRELEELVKPQFDAKGLYFKLDVHPDAVRRIHSDPDKIRQILKNFLANAVKFTAKGGITLSLEPAGGEQAESCPVCLCVSDTGIGIPAAKQGVIFEAFKQADGSTSRRYGGTGLGLTISRQLARLLGGFIRLDSAEGRGARFCLHLPLDFDLSQVTGEQISTESEPAQPVQVEPELPPLRFDGRLVLVLDDDVQNLLRLTPLLEGWGLKVVAAGDTEEAMEVLDEEPVDLLLTDVAMSGADACATIKTVRQSDNYKHLPIVAMSGETGGPPKETCLQAGADQVLAKPVESLRLREALQGLLLRDRGED